MKAFAIHPLTTVILVAIAAMASGSLYDDCICETVDDGNGGFACKNLVCDQLGGECRLNVETKHCECRKTSTTCDPADDDLCRKNDDGTCTDNGCQRTGGKCDNQCQCVRPDYTDLCKEDTVNGVCYDYGCCFVNGKCNYNTVTNQCECCKSVTITEQRMELCKTNSDQTCSDDTKCRELTNGDCVYDTALDECVCRCGCEDVIEGSYDKCEPLACDDDNSRCFFDTKEKDCDCCQAVTYPTTCPPSFIDADVDVRSRRQIAVPLCDSNVCAAVGGTCDSNCLCVYTQVQQRLCGSLTTSGECGDDDICRLLGGVCRQSALGDSCNCVKCP